MTTRRFSFLFLIPFFSANVAAGGCRNVPALQIEDTPDWGDPNDWVEPATIRPGVDLVFVVDNSLNMADGQLRLARTLPALVEGLGRGETGLPDLHVGVISTDLGTAPYNFAGCEHPGGDGGRILKGMNDSCMNPWGQRYVVDVSPRGCTITRTTDTDGAPGCASHDCGQAHCDVAAFAGPDGVATEPDGLILVEDDAGCPRCRNYANETLAEVLSCTTDLGTSGCGMEQPLEALSLALSAPQGNGGFWRPDALVFVVFLSNEDDCSVKNVELFNPMGDLNSTLGTLTSFRCTEFGVVCDQPWQRWMPDGDLTYTGCRPRENNDPKNMLHPLSRYVNLISDLKDPSRVFLAAIAGPTDQGVTVTADLHGDPKLRPSCGSPDDGADPAVRLRTFVEAFPAGHPDWAFTSYCAPDYAPALGGLGGLVADRLDAVCLSGPLVGCPDPAAANGLAPLTALPPEVAAVCAPECRVWEEDAEHRITELPRCPADHADGHPPRLDPTLPVPACWHLPFSPACAVACPTGQDAWRCDPAVNPWWSPSRGAGFRISRRAPAPAGTVVRARCLRLPLYETLCQNGLDDDGDGLADGADPDCR